MLDLGDATSRNLEFSHAADVFVSYGEETITETNLLELRRRHPTRIELETFSKHRESELGADWEWRIIGRNLTLKMRVQAKRVQRDSKLRINHTVQSSGRKQRELLIEHARLDNMKPVYCIYCSEPQRGVWTEAKSPDGLEPFQSGCLLAAAEDVPNTTRWLQDIERACFPWHFLFDPCTFYHCTDIIDFPDSEYHSLAFVRFRFASGPYLLDELRPQSEAASRWNPPTIHDLNQDSGRDFDSVGVAPTTPDDLERVSAGSDARNGSRRSERDFVRGGGIGYSLVMDVRDEARRSRSRPIPTN